MHHSTCSEPLTHHGAFISHDLWQSLALHLFFLVMIILKNTGHIFYRIDPLPSFEFSWNLFLNGIVCETWGRSPQWWWIVHITLLGKHLGWEWHYFLNVKGLSCCTIKLKSHSYLKMHIFYAGANYKRNSYFCLCTISYSTKIKRDSL